MKLKTDFGLSQYNLHGTYLIYSFLFISCCNNTTSLTPVLCLVKRRKNSESPTKAQCILF